jgi:hypothetical protein
MIGRNVPPTAVIEVLVFMRKCALSLSDLIEIGGEDLRHRDQRIVEKARRVERCWGHMAARRIGYDKLAEFIAPDTNLADFLKVLKNQGLNISGPKAKKSAKSRASRNPPSPRPVQPEKSAMDTAVPTNSAPEPRATELLPPAEPTKVVQIPHK